MTNENLQKLSDNKYINMSELFRRAKFPRSNTAFVKLYRGSMTAAQLTALREELINIILETVAIAEVEEEVLYKLKEVEADDDLAAI